MTNKKILAALLCLAMVFTMIPAATYGGDNSVTIDTNPQGETIDNNSGTITTNSGIVTTNSGIVENNLSGGIVKNNLSGGAITTNSGDIIQNQNNGTVDNNSGIIDINYGQVKNNLPYGRVGDNHSYGTVDNNSGTVERNSGKIENNLSGGTINTNLLSGTVDNNSGTVSINHSTVGNNLPGGRIENNYSNCIITTNSGVVNNNLGGEITTNYGSVLSNSGIVVNNFGTVTGGAVTNNFGTVNSGTVTNQYYEITLAGAGTNYVTLTDSTSGSAASAPGYVERDGKHWILASNGAITLSISPAAIDTHHFYGTPLVVAGSNSYNVSDVPYTITGVTTTTAIMVAVLPITYDIIVGNTPVTALNKDNVLNDGTVSYIPATSTSAAILTLDGVDIDIMTEYNNRATFIRATEDLILRLKNQNDIQLFKSAYDLAGIYSTKNLTIEAISGGSLYITAKFVGLNNNTSYGIYVEGELTINGGSIISRASTYGSPLSDDKKVSGIYAKNGITINNSTVTAQAESGQAESGQYAICTSNSGSLTLNGCRILTPAGVTWDANAKGIVDSGGQPASDVTIGIPTKSSGNKTDYYTLTFDTNEGKSIDSVRRSEYTTVDLADFIPTREGYEFTGWYSDKDLKNKITSLKMNQNTTIYAGWKVKQIVNPFTDVTENNWFYDDVMDIHSLGLMKGTSNTLFSPSLDTDRGMLVTMLYRLDGEPSVSGTASFGDVQSGSYYEKAVAWAATNKIVKGYENSKFGPNDKITREQMVTILFRYAVYKGYDVSVGEDTNILSYNDIFSVDEYAIPAFQWACGSGIIQGDKGNLMPDENTTRAQVAAMVNRFHQLSK